MTTIVCIGDARPTSSEHGSSGWQKLTPDLNQIEAQSPTKSCDAIYLIGDFDKVKDSQKSFAASSVNNIPHYYTIGNHEIDDDDPNYVKNLYPYSSYGIPLNSGPNGSEKTTYSMDIGEIHIVNVNIYWDGKTGEFRTDGYIPDALYNWINDDLSSTTKKWKIVLVHEPLYPFKRHTKDSLNANEANRNKFQNLLVKKGVNIVYAAHTHYSHVTTVDGIYHIDCGVSGPKIKDGEDDFASLFYTHTSGNDLVITWKKSPWNSVKTTTYTIKGDGTTHKKYKCKNNTCVEDPSGSFNEPTCNNTCNVQPSGLKSITLTGCASQPKHIDDICTMTPTCKNMSDTTIACPTLIWKSNDNSIVSVTESGGKGKAIALDIGSCNITAEYGNVISNSVPFTVIEKESPSNEGGNSGVLLLALSIAAGYYLNKKGYFKKKSTLQQE